MLLDSQLVLSKVKVSLTWRKTKYVIAQYKCQEQTFALRATGFG